MEEEFQRLALSRLRELEGIKISQQRAEEQVNVLRTKVDVIEHRVNSIDSKVDDLKAIFISQEGSMMSVSTSLIKKYLSKIGLYRSTSLYENKKSITEAQRILSKGFKKVADRIDYRPENDLTIIDMNKRIHKIFEDERRLRAKGWLYYMLHSYMRSKE